MTRQLHDVHERGESIAVLLASEGAIYQRFGYGIASSNVGYEFDPREAVLRDPFEPEGIVTVASSEDDRRVIDYNAEGHQPRVGDEQTIAEIIYWERPEGGLRRCSR